MTLLHGPPGRHRRRRPREHTAWEPRASPTTSARPPPPTDDGAAADPRGAATPARACYMTVAGRGAVSRRLPVAGAAGDPAHGRGQAPRCGLWDHRRRRQALPRRRRRRDRRQRRPRRPSVVDGRWPSSWSGRIRPRDACSRPRRSRPTPTSWRPLLPMDDAADLPGVGWQRGRRDRAQAGPRLPPGPGRAARARASSRGGAPTTGTRSARSTSAARSRCASPTCPGSAASCHVPRRLRVPVREPASTPHGCGAWHAGELDRDDRIRPPPTRRGVHRRAGRRRHAGRGGPVRRLLAGDRRGVPPARRAADRRRGHDRVRPDRALVRRRPLGRPARHPDGGQGRRRAGTVPFGFAAASGGVSRDGARPTGFVHGFTWSHNARRGGGRPRGAAAPARGRPRRRERATWASGSSTACASALEDDPIGRRRSRPRADGRASSSSRDRDQTDAVRPRATQVDRTRPRGGPGRAACSCTPAPVTSTARRRSGHARTAVRASPTTTRAMLVERTAGAIHAPCA